MLQRTQIKHQENSSRLVDFVYYATFGERKSREFHLDNETFEAEQFATPTVQTKWSAQERLRGRGHLLHPLRHLRHHLCLQEGLETTSTPNPGLCLLEGVETTTLCLEEGLETTSPPSPHLL